MTSTANGTTHSAQTRPLRSDSSRTDPKATDSDRSLAQGADNRIRQGGVILRPDARRGVKPEIADTTLPFDASGRHDATRADADVVDRTRHSPHFLRAPCAMGHDPLQHVCRRPCQSKSGKVLRRESRTRPSTPSFRAARTHSRTSASSPFIITLRIILTVEAEPTRSSRASGRMSMARRPRTDAGILYRGEDFAACVVGDQDGDGDGIGERPRPLASERFQPALQAGVERQFVDFFPRRLGHEPGGGVGGEHREPPAAGGDRLRRRGGHVVGGKHAGLGRAGQHAVARRLRPLRMPVGPACLRRLRQRDEQRAPSAGLRCRGSLPR